MLNKDDMLTLSQAAQILDREETRLRGIDVLDPKDVYYNMVSNADEKLSQLLFFLKRKVFETEPYWHEDLLKAVRAGEFRKGCIYEARASKEDHGEYTLTLCLQDTSEEDGWEYTNYLDTDCIMEDMKQMAAEGYNVHLITGLEDL